MSTVYNNTLPSTLAGSLAVLGMMGADTMLGRQLTQLLDPGAFANDKLSQVLQGFMQPTVGPTFKLGIRLLLHTWLVLTKRINPSDKAMGVQPWAQTKIEMVVTDDGATVNPRGSCLLKSIGIVVCHESKKEWRHTIGPKPEHGVHALVEVKNMESETGLPYGSTAMEKATAYGQQLYKQKKALRLTKTVIGCWPLILVGATCWQRSNPIWICWATQVLGVLLVTCSAGYSENDKIHGCKNDCKNTIIYMRMQRHAKAVVKFQVCTEVLKADTSHWGKPTTTPCQCLARIVGATFMSVTFPIGLVLATLYTDWLSILWAISQLYGCITGIYWWLLESGWLLGGFDIMTGFKVDTLQGGTWGSICNTPIPKCAWEQIKG